MLQTLKTLNIGNKARLRSALADASGYILIDIAIVMVVIGLMIGAAVPYYQMYIERNAHMITNKRLDIIEAHISNYIQTRWRVPCPASPIPVDGTAYGVERAACGGAAANAQGIIPYRTLGLPEFYARDGYGNFFTYLVSPDFTNVKIMPAGAGQVHPSLAHLVSGNNFALLPLAEFCAPLAVTDADILIQDENGANLFAFNGARQNIAPVTTTGNNPNANILQSGAAAFTVAPVLALISHGKNGVGAYQSQGGVQMAGAAGNAEAVTLNTNKTVQIQPDKVDAGADYNDDIIRYYTQDTLFGIASGGSCEFL